MEPIYFLEEDGDKLLYMNKKTITCFKKESIIEIPFLKIT